MPVRCTDHLDDLDLGVDAQLVEEGVEILADLDTVVLHLGHREDAQLTLGPHFVLSQQKRDEHEQTAVVCDARVKESTQCACVSERWYTNQSVTECLPPEVNYQLPMILRYG